MATLSNPTMEGHAWIIDGELVFSPNSTQQVHAAPFGTPVFTPGVLSAHNFQEPHWWAQETEWLGFVPRQPVAYSGALLELLAHLPHVFPKLEPHRFLLPNRQTTLWLALDKLLYELVQILGKHIRLKYNLPFSSYEWKYAQGHATEEEAK